MDGFHCRCLRKIFGIPSAYVSGVSNIEVLDRAGSVLLRHKLHQQQLLLYGRIARLPDDDVLRRSILITSDVRPAYFNFHRRGAPRHTWHNQVFQLALKAAGDIANLRRLVKDKELWRSQVIAYTRREQERCRFGAI